VTENTKPEYSKEDAIEVSTRLLDYLKQLKESEPPRLVDMVRVGIGMDQFRIGLITAQAPAEVVENYIYTMEAAMNLLAELIDLEAMGGVQRYKAVQAHIIKKGEEIATELLAARK
jgi:hypothetical protein